jgi:hypothetical protein
MILESLSEPCIDELCDHVVWFGGLLQSMLTPEPALAEAIVARQAAIRERRGQDRELPSALLRARLGLSRSEEAVMWLLATIAIDPDVRRLMAAVCAAPLVNGQPADPTLGALRRIVHGDRPSKAALAELGPDGTLRRLGVIERSDGGGVDVHESKQTFALARGVLSFLHGVPLLDPALTAMCALSAPVALGRLVVEPEAASRVVRAIASAEPAVIVAVGGPGAGRRSLLVAAAAEGRREVLEIDARALPREASALSAILRRVARDCRILWRLPLVRHLEALAPEPGNPEVDRLELVGRELAALIAGPILATSRAPTPAIRWARPVICVELAPTTSPMRSRLWGAALGAEFGSDEDIDFLVTQYPLSPALITEAGRAAHAHARAAGRELEGEDVHAGVRSVLDDRLGHLATRVHVTQTWSDLVLSEDQLGPIHELIARVRHRRQVHESWGYARKVAKGLGVAALFSGPPGTGKTMVAALIARELGLPLYQVDLSRVVSKWIGETEKQLGALFDAAEAGHAIILFDEADALFGKRTEVKSSNDRYANLETNYLLQRLESFTGVCLLTTNHEHNLDPAFARRLALHLRFELPDEDERARLWRAMLPAEAPVEAGLDVGRLARAFALSGGYIRNAALRAAFLAAAERSVITGEHLARAARLEAEGQGKVVGGL